MRAATIYWTKRSINTLADKNDTTGVCKAVNGGTNGLADQKIWLAKAAMVWPDGAVISFPAAPAPQPASPAPVQPALPRQSPAPAPAAPVPEVSPPSPTPPTPKSVGKPTAAAGLLAILGTAIAMRWHEITTWVHSFF